MDAVILSNVDTFLLYAPRAPNHYEIPRPRPSSVWWCDQARACTIEVQAQLRRGAALWHDRDFAPGGRATRLLVADVDAGEGYLQTPRLLHDVVAVVSDALVEETRTAGAGGAVCCVL